MDTSRNACMPGARADEMPATGDREANWPVYDPNDEKVMATLRRWVQGMEEALAKSTSK